MRKLVLFQWLIYCSIPFFIIACKQGKEYVTDSGFKYRLYTENKGAKPQIGDYVTIELVYRTSDSVLFDSRINKTQMRFKLEQIPFKGSYEEGLTYLSEGDSATFYVPADSLYNYYYRNSHEKLDQSATVFKPGSFLLFDIKLLAIQDYVVAEQDQMMKLSEAEKTEKENLIRFLEGKSFLNSIDSGQYFFKHLQKGNGKPVSKGKFVTVKYTGKFLDGKIFDYAGNPVKPFTFRVGSGDVIKGWEYAIAGLRQGDRIELLLPSKNAYGAEGLLDAASGSLLIPPMTTLWYDLEILNVNDTLQLVKK